MYKNIGGKIKKRSQLIAIVEIIAVVIIGINLFASNSAAGMIAGLCIMIVGCLAAWISSWLLYGFGEIIEKVSLIEENTRNKDTKTETYTNI